MARTLVPIAWTCWVLLALLLAYGFVKVAADKSRSPEVGPGLGVMVMAVLAVILAIVGLLLRVAAQRQSRGGMIALTILLAYPLVLLAAQPLVIGFKSWKWSSEAARQGSFRDSTVQEIANAIRAGDGAAITTMLKGQTPLMKARDREGNDLLAFAVIQVRDHNGSADPVRALLDAGFDPKTSRTGDGDVDGLNYLAIGTATPAMREAVRLLLEHGADPNALHPASKDTPLRQFNIDIEVLHLLVEHGADIDRIQSSGVPVIVDLIGTKQWEAAQYLVEKGANLDLKNEHGLSVDYYLEDWKDSVHGEHPPEWDRLREAIAKRRAGRGT
jgi:hypothetical protein